MHVLPGGLVSHQPGRTFQTSMKESIMKFSDILALAKQGYSPQDIKDLLALATEDTQTGTEGEAAEPEKAPATEPEADEPAAEPQGGADPETEESDRIKELESKVKDLQESNTRRARPEEPKRESDEQILADMARRFM